MNTYHKIQTVYFRDPNTNYKTLLEGTFGRPEFEYLANNIWDWDEKIDGTNIRVMFDGEKVFFGGKAEKSQMPVKLVNRLNEFFIPKLDLFKNIFGEGPNEDGTDKKICFYGEGYGAGIQKGGNYRKDQDYILFDIKVGSWWLKREDVKEIAESFGMMIVPKIGSGTLYQMVEYVRNGFNSLWGDFKAEGIVARPRVELKSRSGERIITKLKCNDFKG